MKEKCYCVYRKDAYVKINFFMFLKRKKMLNGMLIQ